MKWAVKGAMKGLAGRGGVAISPGAEFGHQQLAQQLRARCGRLGWIDQGQGGDEFAQQG